LSLLSPTSDKAWCSETSSNRRYNNPRDHVPPYPQIAGNLVAMYPLAKLNLLSASSRPAIREAAHDFFRGVAELDLW
jgi:hypothetical protein